MTNLFTYPVAKGKTDTSEFAGKITEKGAGPLREQVYYAVKMGGTLGLTSSEIADVVCRDYAGVQPRTSELASLGYLKDSGQRRRAPGRRCAEIVWVVAKPL
jgi:hypothetical protein|tara:strand:- start:336 stop:641 length:306 start_codon:yes stop_codon:yes gene_type:complete